LSQAIEKQQNLKRSETHVLNGLYVPALHDIMSYETPIEEHEQDASEKQRRHIVAWYLLDAVDFLGSVKYGYPDQFRWCFLMRLSELFTKPPTRFSQPKFVDCGALIQWDFVFRENDLNFVVSVRDAVPLEEKWLRQVKEKLDRFAKDRDAHQAILVASRIVKDGETSTVPDEFAFLVVDADPIAAAERAFSTLMQPLGSELNEPAAVPLDTSTLTG
jgi:hypothetical protein